MAQLNSPVDYHEALAKIASGITQLITEPRGSSKPFPQQYWMEMYTLVFKICSNTEDPRPRELYTDVSALLERHCQGFRQMLERLQLQDLLPAYLRIFERFFTGMENVAGILNYLNRWWIKSQCALPNFDAHAAGVFSVELLPYVIWYDELYTPLREGIFAAMMDCVSQTRQEATFVRGRPLLAAHDGTFSQLRSAVDSYVKLEENLRKLPKPAGHGTDDGGRPGGRPRIHNPYAAFEDSFIRASVEHYTRKGQELAQNGDAVCTEFMLSVERLLQQEARSVEKWVPAPCLAKCTECCLIALVYPHRELLHGAIPELLKADRQEDLRRLYRLLKPVHGLPPLLQALQQHVEDTGVEFLRQLDVSSTKSIGKGSKGNTAVKDSRSYAQGLWRLHSRSQGVVSFCCEGDVQCAAAVGGALRTVVNSAPRSAEALARFVNSAIASDRKFAIRSQDPQTGGAASEDADQGSFHNRHDSGAESGKKALVQLKMAGDLIKYIDDKDIFMHFTSRLMAKRLIQGGSDSPSSLELEEALIRILRPTCGHDFASRLQRMCTDCKLVPDLAARFDEWREKYYAVQATTRTAKKSTYVNPMVLNDEYIEDDMDGDVDGNDADTPSSGVGDDVGGAELASEKLPPVDETVSFQLLCLTAGSWPVGPQTPATAAAAGGGRSAVAAPTAANQLLDDTAVLAAGFALPAPLERWRGAFETFYTESFSGRKVTWCVELPESAWLPRHLELV
jgi:cullin 1